LARSRVEKLLADDVVFDVVERAGLWPNEVGKDLPEPLVRVPMPVAPELLNQHVDPSWISFAASGDVPSWQRPIDIEFFLAHLTAPER
jgi:hypothetical protein